MVTLVKVIEKSSKRGIGHVWVHVYNSNYVVSDATDNNGVAEFYDLPFNHYTIKIRTKTHRPYTKKFQLQDGMQVTIMLDRAY